MGTNRARRWLPTRMWTSLGWMFVLLQLAVSVVTAEPNFPVLSGRVVDDAGILDAATIQNLTGMLEQHELGFSNWSLAVTLSDSGVSQ